MHEIVAGILIWSNNRNIPFESRESCSNIAVPYVEDLFILTLTHSIFAILVKRFVSFCMHFNCNINYTLWLVNRPTIKQHERLRI